MDNIISALASELNISEAYVQNVINLIDEGNTIPFIARYRKEMHGSQDDTTLRTLEERLNYLRGLNERKDEVKRAIEEQGKLTEELSKAIDEAETLARVEDLYRPYKQKRRTRASIAKEKGLEPLAELLFAQDSRLPELTVLAEKYVDEEKGVATAEEALAGAADIIAENISDSANIRERLRSAVLRNGIIRTEKAKDGDSVYGNYYEYSEPVRKIQNHRVLAINRGEKEGFLKVDASLDKDEAVNIIHARTVKKGSASTDFVAAAGEDAWARLIGPSVERETRSSLPATANKGAIHNFALNLRQLLMQPPVKGHVTMGLDPGYRMGCKIAVIDSSGKVLDTAVVYPTHGERQKNEAIAKLSAMIKKHKVEHLAIGNGTASRETEQMAVEMIKGMPDRKLSYMMVNEAGASVYSASKLAAEEFPQYDVNLRSAVSIARRLQDPLAELVKIEPKAIGVGQYQHDMPQKQLADTLAGVVEDCVNAVGVDLNTASPSLLSYISGLSGTLSKNVVAYREENGAFTSRKELLKVPKLGSKAFKQCAGFLRVPESREPLDNTGVHPESYEAAYTLLKLLGYDKKDLKSGALTELPLKLKLYGEEKAAGDCGIGLPTLQDIVKELLKPGRDIRDELPAPVLRSDVLDAKDLRPGMILTGTVRNVIDFGAFVDIGVHQDGLVHISEIADRFIKHPSEALKVGDVVKVIVLKVDESGKRISLSIKQAK
ncbi:MAG: RNA-binding transcriptional accessory protein [Oscillospiraceae bacterium]|nr:RNA-binding transcriptional accessory protein [Oscillospiraceae bacterium]